MTQHIGVILVALGGPHSLDDVGPFMTAFMGKPAPLPVVAAVQERYKLIGGKSPLVEIVKCQAHALENKLGPHFRVYAGFRHSNPTIAEAYESALKNAADTVVAMSLSPYETIITTGSYKKAFDELHIPENRFTFIPSFHDNPSFLQAWQDSIDQVTSEFERSNSVFIFTSHSLPMHLIDSGDPYKNQVEETVAAISSKLSLKHWVVGWQSKGARSTEPWLEPSVESILESIAKSGTKPKQVVEIPIGFTCDHLETLYDIDIVHKGIADSLGLSFKRVASLNTNPAFINALADIINKQTSSI